MRSFLIACLTLLLAALLSFPASAQVQEGLSEINLSGAWNTVDSGESSTYSLMLAASYGYFLLDRLEAGVDGSVSKIKEEEAIGSVGPFVSYHHPFSREAALVPFIGLQGGTTFGYEKNLLYYGAFLGVKAFIGRSGGGAVTLQAFYLRQDPSGRTEPFDQYGLLTGISIFLK